MVVKAEPGSSGQSPFLIEKGEQVHSVEEAKAVAAEATPVIPMAADEGPFEPKEGEPELEQAVSSDEKDIATEDEDQAEELLQAPASEERQGRKRPRRRGGGRGGKSHLEVSSPREPIPISPEQSVDSAPYDELLEASAENAMTPATTYM